MKQLLFLLLFPCLALAQYTGNAGQKITLGEQTTADGLVFRGVASIDTVTATSKITRVNKQDTSAFLLLDTVTNLLWHYKIGSNGWIQAGGGVSVSSFSAGTTGLTPSTATTGAVTLGGTLAVANGGTGSVTQNFVDLTTTQSSIAGAKTFTSAITATRFNPTSSTATGNGMFLPTTNALGFSTNGFERVRIRSDGNVGYGTTNPVSLLHIEAAGGTTLASSDQFRVSSGVSGNRAEFHLTDNITSDGYISFKPSSTAASRYLEITTNGSAGGIIVDGNGNVGIGTTSPTEKLHVVGNARITGAYSVTTGSAANVFVTTDGVLQRSTSSIKYKTDVEDYSKGLKEVMQLRPVTFKSINSNNDKTYAGFIAEELADLKLNELVENNDSGEPDAISYAYMVTLLTKAIQEQQEQINLLKKRLLILENK
jgi:hypothetical protein